MNPVEAGIAENPDYKWSSYKEHKKGSNDFADTEFTLRIISQNKTFAIKDYIRYMNEEMEDIEKCEYAIVDNPINEVNRPKDKIELRQWILVFIILPLM